MNLKRYADLMANVRQDGYYHHICGLVQPLDPEVWKAAMVLHNAPNFVAACQELVNSFTTYQREIGDFWGTPAETLERRAGDCDDKSILLVSLLRNYIPPDKVYCAFGHWSSNGKRDGHMWVVMDSGGMEDKIIEATAGPKSPLKGNYHPEAIFNDRYAFAYPEGIKNFALLTVGLDKLAA